jgi:hemerythrin-like domain-containing protein
MTAETTFGEALVQELRWIHDEIRRDLAIVRDLADAVMAGEPAADVAEQLRELETRGPLWQLRYGCLHYCRHVHGHHTFEDTAWFPGLRAANPALAPTIDRLQVEHRQVADLLHEVEIAAVDLETDDSLVTRARVRDALARLDEHLLAHLAFEEETITPTLLELTVPPWMVPGQ